MATHVSRAPLGEKSSVNAIPQTIQRGFTAVELLVAIAVIAILLGILMPAVRHVRASAHCATCMGNLRQAHQSVCAYAAMHDDRAPLGYRAGRKQWNSMIYSATAQRFVLFGALYQQGLMQPPAAFFCPAERDPRSMFDVPENPWPPGPDGDSSKHTYAGYGARPEHQLPDDPAEYASTGMRMPWLGLFGQRAMLADLTATPDRVDSRHQTGVNVQYADGSCQWVDRHRFDDALQQCPTISPEANRHQDEIWAAFDRRR